MIDTTLCYIEKDGCYLLLHRVKKERDINRDKWIGIGGKSEPGETPLQCVKRETREETGLELIAPRYCGVVDFYCGGVEERMHLFHADRFTGTLTECDEGVLEWVPIEKNRALPQWEGDRLFLERMERGAPFFQMALYYEGNRLIRAEADGEIIIDKT